MQKSFELALGVYELTDRFPTSERFRLIDQLCRACVSVPANIGEGEGRFTTPDQLKYLYIAQARNYGAPADFDRLRALDDDVGRLLNGLIRAKRSYEA